MSMYVPGALLSSLHIKFIPLFSSKHSKQVKIQTEFFLNLLDCCWSVTVGIKMIR